MSRSRILATSVAVLLLAIAARPVHAQKGTLIDAIGMVDYSAGRPGIKVGSWVRYHVTGKSDLGATDDYTVTLLIAGEQEWWGEDCFWVETWTTLPGGHTQTAATLVSYAIFDDSLAVPHILLYQRKRITELDPQGVPVEQILRRGSGALKSRTPPGAGLARKVDSLGTETVKSPRGDLFCYKVRTEQAASSTGQSADSMQYTENRVVRVGYRTRQVPVTGIAREELDFGIWRRTWLSGRSQETAPLRVLDRSTGTVELVDFGTAGLKANFVPERFRRSLTEQRATQSAPPRLAKPRATAAKPATGKPATAKPGTLKH